MWMLGLGLGLEGGFVGRFLGCLWFGLARMVGCGMWMKTSCGCGAEIELGELS